MASSKPRALLPARLLLLLRDGDSYGRALCERLDELGLCVDTSTSSRMLRALDQEGAITSHWIKSDIGPARRSYRLTPRGRRRLAQFDASITASWQLYERFLREHERVRTGQEPMTEASSDRPKPSSHRVGAFGRRRRGRSAARAVHCLAATAARRGWALVRLWLAPRPARPKVDTDRSALYRLLRALESDGRLQSAWIPPTEGPQRRSYELPAEGRRNLDKLVTVIKADHEAFTAFVHAYQPVGRAAYGA